MTKVVDKIVDASAVRIIEIARAACQSKTLRAAIRIVPHEDGFDLTVPHYWAVFYHDGRGPVVAAPGKKLVFYKNPADDPRIAGGYPVRLSQVRRLSKAEFYRDLRAGKLIVRDSVGPAPPHEFMGDTLTAKADQIVSLSADVACTQATREALGDLFNASVDTRL